MASTAEQAYAEAERQIEEARRQGQIGLDLSNLEALETLPPMPGLTGLQALYMDNTQVADLAPLQALTGLQLLYLDNTQVTDLTPLQALTGLQALGLNKTQVADLAPLQALTGLQALSLNNTQVADLRPIAWLRWEFDEKRSFYGLNFKNTPAADASPELAALAEVKDARERTDKTFAYLRSLPPYPEPLPWEVPAVIAAAPAAVTTAQTHITFLLSHAALNYVHAQTTAGQIKAALRDVPATNGNQLAPLLQISYDFATVLENLGAQSDAATDERERLLTRIAELEGIVQMLTAGLKDKDAMTEAASTLPEPEGGLAKSYKTASGEELAKFQFFLAKTGLITSAIHFLGTSSPLVTALLAALK